MWNDRSILSATSIEAASSSVIREELLVLENFEKAGGSGTVNNLRKRKEAPEQIIIMGTKEKIIQKIQPIEDEPILEDVSKMIDLELAIGEDKVQLTDEQKAAIDEGLADSEAGRSLSHAEVRQIIDEWMRKK
jgi:hypothetical protein